MTKEKPFTPQEGLFIWMIIGKSGFPNDFVEALQKKTFSLTDWGTNGIGRPKITSEASFDAKRARLVDHFIEDFPDMTVTDAVDHGRSMRSLMERAYKGDLPQYMLDALFEEEPKIDGGRIEQWKRLFPQEGDLASSVSRGRKANKRPKANK